MHAFCSRHFPLSYLYFARLVSDRVRLGRSRVGVGVRATGRNRCYDFTLAFFTATLSDSPATAKARRATLGSLSSSSQEQASCITRTAVRRGAPGSSPPETMAPSAPLASAEARAWGMRVYDRFQSQIWRVRKIGGR